MIVVQPKTGTVALFVDLERDNARATAGPAAVALGGVAAAVGGGTTLGSVTALAPLPGPLLVPEQMV